MTVTVVTGANSGIGRATAVRLAQAGHTVFGTMRDLAKGDKLAAKAEEAGVTVTPIVADAVDGESIEQAISQVEDAAGSVDVMVNNAGIGYNATAEDTDMAEAMKVLDTNLLGPLRFAKRVAPGMRAKGSGTIVQISSIAGLFPLVGQPMYCASKHGLKGLSETMAMELAPFGVKVRIVEPGVTLTAILAKNGDFPQTDYTPAYHRMFDMYAAGIAGGYTAEGVADTVLEAIESDSAQLHWACAWGGAEMAAARPNITDEQLIELGSLVNDGAAWRAKFEELLGVSLGDGAGLS